MQNKSTIGVIGAGMVGGATIRYFESIKSPVVVYDPFKGFTDKTVLEQADFIFICVPTPYEEASGGFSLTYVRDALSITPHGKIVVIKSTVLPGSTEALQKEYPEVKILFNPEFLTEESADQDMRFPDRQVIGYTKESYGVSADLMLLLPLAPFGRIMPATEAEMVKYYANTWFSTKVVFANQMYDVCEKMGINYDTVKESAAADKRIGRSHLDIFHKGARGYGGKCLPKDTRAMIQLGERIGAPQDLLKAVEQINNKLTEDGTKK